MECAEHLIHWCNSAAVVAFKVFVVEVVKVTTALNANIIFQQDLFITCMTHGSIEDCKLELIESIERV